jgi:hypothetical protein
MASLSDGLRGAARLLSAIGHVRVGLRCYAFALLPAPFLLLAVLLPLSVFYSPEYAPAFLAFGIGALSVIAVLALIRFSRRARAVSKIRPDWTH